MVDNSQGTVEEAERRLRAAQASGDRAAEADVRARKAYLHVARGEIDAAIADMGAARDLTAALAARDGDMAALGRMEYGYGLVLERAEGRADEALAVFGRAARLARELGDRVGQMKAQHRMVAVYEANQRYRDAIAELTIMIRELEGLGNQRGLVDCYRHRAMLAQLMGVPGDARADYDRAVDAADKQSDSKLRLLTRIERRALMPALGSSTGELEPWADILAMAGQVQEQAGTGDQPLSGMASLEHAAALMREGRVDQALDAAADACRAALDSGLPMLYLLASLLTAEGRDSKGERPAVIGALLACKASLEKQFGKETGQPVVQILDSLPHRWGRERFAEALAVYRSDPRAYGL